MTDATSSAQVSFDLSPGLLEYYSSQAESMLTQFENINRLLGPTSDWTHPGDFCEILLRDFFRRFLPPHLSADKGYFYGRTAIHGKDTHCPEIDILIHDSQAARPIFRMGDFVIVRPEAVRGIIQVKRRFDKGQIRKGMRNVVLAKRHLLGVLSAKSPNGRLHWSDTNTFNAVIGFQDHIGADDSYYHRRLLALCKSDGGDNASQEIATEMSVLPDFIGTLTGYFVASDGLNVFNRRYLLLNSIIDGVNVSIQALLDLKQANAACLSFAISR
jgi:hypothetical protein